MRRRFPEAETAYQLLKTINDPALIDEWLAGVVQAQLACFRAAADDAQRAASNRTELKRFG